MKIYLKLFGGLKYFSYLCIVINQLKNIEMEKVTGYKLSDGRIIENEFEAIRLQKEIDFEIAIRKFADEHGVYNSRKEAIYNAIMENKVELSKIFGTF